MKDRKKARSETKNREERALPTAGKDIEMAVRRLECDREETAAVQGGQRRVDERFRKELEETLTDRECGPTQESENFDGQVKEAQCEVGVRRSVKDDGGRCASQVTGNNSSSDVWKTDALIQQTEFKDEIRS